MTVDDGFARAVRHAAAFAASKGPEWGVVTHEDPFENRAVEATPVAAGNWEKHGVDARGACAACEIRALNLEVLGVAELTEGEATVAVVRPLAEAQSYGLQP